MKKFKELYDNLEIEVQKELRNKINSSSYISKFTGEKAIEVNIFDYLELTIINDRLTFLDSNGLYYSIFSNVDLSDLIDILE